MDEWADCEFVEMTPCEPTPQDDPPCYGFQLFSGSADDFAKENK